MCGTQELCPKIDPDFLCGDGWRNAAPPPRQFVFTGWTRERGKDPAEAPITFNLIIHIEFGKFGNFLQASSPESQSISGFWLQH